MLHKLPNFYRVEHHGQQTAGTEYKIYSALSRKFQKNFAICQKSLKHTDPKQTTGQPAYQTDRPHLSYGMLVCLRLPLQVFSVPLMIKSRQWRHCTFQGPARDLLSEVIWLRSFWSHVKLCEADSPREKEQLQSLKLYSDKSSSIDQASRFTVNCHSWWSCAVFNICDRL